MPLSTLDFDGDFTYQPGSTTEEVYQRAIAHFDSALTLAGDSVAVANLAVSLAGLAWGVEHGYLAIAVCMVVMTIGLRTVMTICAIALVDAMPDNRTSIGTALNDTAQEVGTSVGTAVVGTVIAALVTTRLPTGSWGSALVASFFHGERITYAVLAVVVGVIAAAGALTLTDSRSTEEHD